MRYFETFGVRLSFEHRLLMVVRKSLGIFVLRQDAPV
jgi:hypothetical protein